MIFFGVPSGNGKAYNGLWLPLGADIDSDDSGPPAGSLGSRASLGTIWVSFLAQSQ